MKHDGNLDTRLGLNQSAAIDSGNLQYDTDFRYDYTSAQIVSGALKGVIMLQDTYNQDIKGYVRGSIISKTRHKFLS